MPDYFEFLNDVASPDEAELLRSALGQVNAAPFGAFEAHGLIVARVDSRRNEQLRTERYVVRTSLQIPAGAAPAQPSAARHAAVDFACLPFGQRIGPRGNAESRLIMCRRAAGRTNASVVARGCTSHARREGATADAQR